ncbi:MAG: hypothetical protein K2N73_00210 [Lachnospiraceae bacterium]|nr:hypothetical protein [Lachnospiraceae bacterium]
MAGKFANRLRMFLNGGSEGKGRPTKETMLIVFLSGILIFVIMLPTNKSNSSYSKKKNQEAKNLVSTDNVENLYQQNDWNSGTAAEQYRKGLEKELEDFLSSVAGVGDVKVLIYMKNSQEYVVEKDTPTSSATSGESSELRKEESTVYTINTEGNEVPFISQTKSPKIDGVVVAAKGASDEGIRLQIVKLVMALYGVEANKVEVLQME